MGRDVMISIHLVMALSYLEEALKNMKADDPARKAVVYAKRELLAAQDELIWIRSKGREIARAAAELKALLGIADSALSPAESLALSPYLEYENTWENGKRKVRLVEAAPPVPKP